MPDNGYKEKCSTHKITERWCEEHETWEYYCVRCCKWKDHSSLFLNILGRGFICTSCGSEISEFREERRDEYYQKSNEELESMLNYMIKKIPQSSAQIKSNQEIIDDILDAISSKK